MRTASLIMLSGLFVPPEPFAVQVIIVDWLYREVARCIRHPHALLHRAVRQPNGCCPRKRHVWGRRQSRQAWGRGDGFAVSGRFGNLGGKKKHIRGRNNPSTLSLTVRRRAKPQPLTLNHPASNPGCSSGWGSFFLGHRNAAKMIPGLS
jgi:hypothetical protein